MNNIFKHSGSVSQEDISDKYKALQSQISTNILSKITNEIYDWEPTISSEVVENSRNTGLSSDQVDVLSKFNQLARLSDTFRDVFLYHFKNNRNPDSLVFQSMDLVKWNFIELFKF